MTKDELKTIITSIIEDVEEIQSIAICFARPNLANSGHFLTRGFAELRSRQEGYAIIKEICEHFAKQALRANDTEGGVFFSSLSRVVEEKMNENPTVEDKAIH